MNFDGKVHFTTVIQMKHTKENHIRTNLEWFICRLGIQKCKAGEGQGCQRTKEPLLLLQEVQSRPPCQTYCQIWSMVYIQGM